MMWIPKPKKAKKQKQEPQDNTSKSKTPRGKRSPLRRTKPLLKPKRQKPRNLLKKKETFLSPRRERKGRKQMETWERKAPGIRMDSPISNQTPNPGKLLVKKVTGIQKRKYPWSRKKVHSLIMTLDFALG